MDDAMSFGTWLRRWRKALDLTQTDLSTCVGYSVATIRKIEMDLRRPSKDLADQLATCLAIEADARVRFLRVARGGADPALLDLPPMHAATSAPRPGALPSLPLPPTPLIGREQEVADVCALLRRSRGRLVTLTGPGGVGKTRVALEVVMEAAPHFADGVVFVPLAPLADAALVVPTIARMLGLQEAGGRPIRDVLHTALAPKNLLLVLDNLEHVLPAAPDIAELLRTCPRLVVLTTSRAPLHVCGEQEYAVGPLTLPDLHQVSTVDDVAGAAAVQLFMTHAQQVVPTLALTTTNAPAIAAICRRLDGLPLALELAAARVKLLSPRTLLARLDDALPLLTGGACDLPARQHTIRHTLDWSYDLLNSEEQRLFRRLAVFRGGWDLAAAEAVGGSDHVLERLGTLLDHSLVVAYEADDHPRYRLLEPVRQYAAEHLATDPTEMADAHEQHCRYYAHWISARDAIIRSSQQHVAVAEITLEIDNVRAAWQHAVDQRQVDVLWLMSQAAGLHYFYALRSWHQEGGDVCQRAIAALRTPPPHTRQEEILLGSLMGVQGFCAFHCGQPERGLQLLHEGLALLRPGDHPLLLVLALEQLTYLTFLNGEFERAVALLEEDVALAQQFDDPWLRAHTCFLRAVVYTNHAPQIAYARFQEGLPHIRAAADRFMLGMTFNYLGVLARDRGDLHEAEHRFGEALRCCAEFGDAINLVSALNGLAHVACARQAWADAITRCQEALALADKVGDFGSRAKTLVTLGIATAGTGDRAAARHHFAHAITVSLAARVLPTAIEAWLELAALDLADGERSIPLLTILALVRDDAATSCHAAATATALWTTLATEGDPHMLADAEHTARHLAPDQVGPLVRAYAEGDAAGMLTSMAWQPG